MPGVDLSQIPNLEDNVTERLALCALDIMTLSGLTIGTAGGNGRAWQYPPAQKIVKEDLPAVYHMIGATFEYGQVSKGEYVSAVNYIQRWLIAPFASGADDLTAGNEMWTRAAPYFSLVPFYFRAYPRLATSTLEDLQYCAGINLEKLQAPEVPHEGLVGRPAPGGQLFACIDFVLPIVMKMNVRRA